MQRFVRETQALVVPLLAIAARRLNFLRMSKRTSFSLAVVLLSASLPLAGCSTTPDCPTTPRQHAEERRHGGGSAGALEAVLGAVVDGVEATAEDTDAMPVDDPTP